jgi:hypothetical protein
MRHKTGIPCTRVSIPGQAKDPTHRQMCILNYLGILKLTAWKCDVIGSIFLAVLPARKTCRLEDILELKLNPAKIPARENFLFYCN